MDKNPDNITQTNSGYSRPVCMTLNDRNDVLNTFYEYCNTCVMFFGSIFDVLTQIHLGAEHPTTSHRRKVYHFCVNCLRSSISLSAADHM